jgi:Mg2+ and Co2+ transporter CorA
VDPAFATAREMLPDESANSATKVGTAKRKRDKPENDKVEPSELRTLDKCLILQDPETFSDRAELWESQGLDPTRPLQLKKVAHESWPYHKGCSTLAPLMFSEVGLGTEEMNLPIFQEKRNLTSALGEMVFYWTKVAKPDLIQQTNQKSSNAAYFLLKHVAQHWVNQLELMNTTIARGEWFSDDYQAQIDNTLSRKKWKDDLKKINEIAKDINYMRRHLNHFWRAMYLNLERLGVQLGNESVNEKASWAIQDAQKDFITIHTRMQPLRDRAEALNSVSNDLANLRAAFRGVSDGDFSLRLSLFASIVFPLTLLAGIFSMGDDYRPGKKNFWQLWGYGIPVCVVVALALVYGTRPWMVFIDMWKRIRPCLERVKLMKTKEDKAKQKRESECTQKQTPEENGSSGLAKLMRRKGWDNRDEESSVGK